MNKKSTKPVIRLLYWFLLAAILAFFAYLFFPILRQRSSLISSLNAISSANNDTEREISKVNENISQLDDPEYVEHLAHKEKYVRKGEVVYEYVGD